MVIQLSSFDPRLTYGASHLMACDAFNARTLTGGEYLSSAVVASSGNHPEISKLVVIARFRFGRSSNLFDAAHQFPDLTEKLLPGRALFNFQGALSFIA